MILIGQNIYVSTFSHLPYFSKYTNFLGYDDNFTPLYLMLFRDLMKTSCTMIVSLALAMTGFPFRSPLSANRLLRYRSQWRTYPSYCHCAQKRLLRYRSQWRVSLWRGWEKGSLGGRAAKTPFFPFLMTTVVIARHDVGVTKQTLGEEVSLQIMY